MISKKHLWVRNFISFIASRTIWDMLNINTGFPQFFFEKQPHGPLLTPPAKINDTKGRRNKDW